MRGVLVGRRNCSVDVSEESKERREHIKTALSRSSGWQQTTLSLRRLRAPLGQDLGQRPFNAIDFFANHADGLLIGRKRHGRDGVHRVTNLVVAVPYQVDSLGGRHSVPVNPFDQLRRHPGKRQPEQHFEWQTIGRSIEIEKREPIDGFAKAKRSEDHSHSNQAKCQAVKGSKFRRRLIHVAVLSVWHCPPKTGLRLLQTLLCYKGRLLWAVYQIKNCR